MRKRWIVFFTLMVIWAVITAGLFTSSLLQPHTDEGMAHAGMAEIASVLFGVVGAALLLEMAVLNWCL